MIFLGKFYFGSDGRSIGVFNSTQCQWTLRNIRLKRFIQWLNFLFLNKFLIFYLLRNYFLFLFKMFLFIINGMIFLGKFYFGSDGRRSRCWQGDYLNHLGCWRCYWFLFCCFRFYIIAIFLLFCFLNFVVVCIFLLFISIDI